MQVNKQVFNNKQAGHIEMNGEVCTNMGFAMTGKNVPFDTWPAETAVAFPMELKFTSQKAKEAYQVNGEFMPHTAGSAGYDLRAMIDEPVTIKPGQAVLIGSGLAIWIRYNFMAGFIIPRSGLGHKEGIVVGNLTGLIDSDYQGEIKISCWNRSSEERVINPNERIAQLVFAPVFNPTFNEVNEFSNETIRGESGFGGTGKT